MNVYINRRGRQTARAISTYLVSRCRTITSTSPPTGNDIPAENCSSSPTNDVVFTPLLPSQALPISPLMDPVFIAARQRRHLPKSPPKNPTPFQKRIAKNPFARTLASPIRRCKVTGVVLPRDLLLGYNVIEDPKTGVPFWVPRKLTRPPKASKGTDGDKILGTVDKSVGYSHKSDVLEKLEDTNIDPDFFRDLEDEEDELDLPQRTTTTGQSNYTILSYALLTTMANDKEHFPRLAKSTKAEARSIPPALFRIQGMAHNKVASKALAATRWRPDMGELVLDLLRRRIVEGLVHLVAAKRGYVNVCIKKSLGKSHIGALLWFGHLPGKGENSLLEPGEYHVLDLEPTRKRKPVYNMRVLLGEEWRKQLVERTKGVLKNNPFEREAVVVRNQNMCIEVLQLLWKLQVFLAGSELWHLPKEGQS